MSENTNRSLLSAVERARTAVAVITTAWEPGEQTFPWRTVRTPYRILLAEMLLVRTRADVVARHFEGILARFPDLEALATATEREIEEALRPLGLRKRAGYILRAARYISEKYNGNIPRSFDELKHVPGLGDYTAAAVAVFAYGEKRLPADVNILRFLSRVTGIPMGHVTKGSPDLRAVAAELPEAYPDVSVEKVLDFTRTVCLPRRPRCRSCPVADRCTYSLQGKGEP